jgi:DNA-binding MarR family transcriptional regulator
VNHLPADPATRTGYLLWQTGHAVSRVMSAALEPVDLTPAQFSALVHVSREPGVSAAELARRINLTPQSMQTALLALVHRELVERRPHPVHRRVIGLYPTAGTAETLDQAEHIVRAADEGLVADLDADEAETFHRLLRRVLTTVNPTSFDRTSLRPPTALPPDRDR